MNLVPTSASMAFGTAVLKSKKNSPHIFFGLGLIGAISAVVMACRATLDLEDVLDEVREDVEEANRKAEAAVVNDFVAQADAPMEVFHGIEHERAKEVSVITLKGAVAVGKLYGPAIVVGGLSIACLAGSHVQLTRRNAALTAAFTALGKAYEDYRERVRQELGAEREMEIYRGVEIREVTGADGKKELVRAVNPNGLSPYARIYDASNPEWRNNAEHNRTVLHVKESWANHKLNRDGHLLLNDVYDQLGFERTSDGCIVGWVKNSDVGDNYVDFGLFEARNTDFINTIEPTIWLDFNVDGIVYDKLP